MTRAFRLAVLAYSFSAASPAATADSPRRVLAFYYTWYGTPGVEGRWRHWNENGHFPQRRDERGWEDIGAAQHPLDGLYDSKDPVTIRRHASLSEEAGIDGWISTWWGIGDQHDQALKLVLQTLEDLRSPIEVAPYYETCGGDAGRARRDLRHLLGSYGRHPRFLRHEGKPVVFIYSRALSELSPEAWEGVISDVQKDHPCLFIADTENPRLIASFGGGHNYNPVGLVNGGTDMGSYYRRFVELCRSSSRDPALHDQDGRIKAPLATATVIPGYDDRRVRDPGLFCSRQGGETYAGLWRKATAASPDWILITSFNEWHEGTEIEPSREHGYHYLEDTRKRAAHFKRTGREPVLLDVTGESFGIDPAKLDIRIRGPAAGNSSLILQRDLFRRALVLENLGAEPLEASLSGFQGTALAYSKGVGTLEAPFVRALATAFNSTRSIELLLTTRGAVHLWAHEELERYLRDGGYQGDRAVRADLKAGYCLSIHSPLLRKWNDPVLTVTPGIEAPFEVGLIPLRGTQPEGRRPSFPGHESPLRIEGEPRITLNEGTIYLSKDLPMEGELPLTLRWGDLSRRLVARFEPPLMAEVIDARRDRISITLRPRFFDLMQGPLEALIRIGDSPVGRVRTGNWQVTDLPTARGGEDPCRPRTLELIWNGVVVRRDLLLAARIDLTAGASGEGLWHVGHSGQGDGNTELVETGGIRARAPRRRPGAREHYLYFDLDAAFVSQGPTEVRVEHLDSGTGWFQLHYDSREEGLPLGGAYKPTSRIEVGSSGGLRTSSFRLEDAAFRGRQNFGADFRICASDALRVTRIDVQKSAD